MNCARQRKSGAGATTNVYGEVTGSVCESGLTRRGAANASRHGF